MSVRHSARASDIWSWFTHSPVGLMLMQVPVLPLLLVRVPRVAAMDLSGLGAFAVLVLTALTLWFTVRG